MACIVLAWEVTLIWEVNKVRTVPFANALTIVVLAVHLLGAVAAATSPGAYLGLLGSWVFLDLTGLAVGGVVLTASSLLLSIVTVAIVTWLFGAALALVYNALTGEREVRA